ncbi:MAG: TolC family protein [Bacteroidia bacterium]|nr:TolC family protein [Bacteroidia bacterium]
MILRHPSVISSVADPIRHRLRRVLSSLALLAAVGTSAAQSDTLTLEAALNTGLEASYGIRIARNNQSIATEANTPGAAGMLPTVGWTTGQNAAFNNTRLQFFSGEERVVNWARSLNFTTSVQLNWTLFDGFAMYVNRDRLTEFEALQPVLIRQQVAQTAYQITLAYYAIVNQEELLRVLRESLALSAERRQLATGKLRIGAGSELSLLQARVDFNTDSSAIVRQEALLRQSRARLNRLMLLPPDSQVNVVRYIPLNDQLTLATLENLTLTENPDLMLALADIRLAELDIRQARAGLYPSLNMSTGVGFSRSSNQAGVLQSNRGYGPSGALTLSYNLFDGGQVRRNISRSEYLLENRTFAYESLREDLRTDLYVQYQAYRSSLDLIGIEAANLEIARQTARIAAGKYRLGAANDLEVRQAQVNLVEAENRLLSARYAAKVAETDLLLLAGTLQGDN